MNVFTAESFAGVVSQRMAAEAIGLSAQWFVRLKEILPVATNDVFPSDEILDHIPALIEAVARYISAPEDEEIAANAVVIDKARELGNLRHQQKASVHQILREFEILGELLEGFAAREAAALTLAPPSPEECFDVFRRITRASRTLMGATVDTFVAEYTSTIEERNERLRLFNRMASHELRTPLGALMFAAAALRQPLVRSDEARLDKIADSVRNSTERLTRLIENFQKIARISESPDAPNLQRVELAVIASEVARQLEEMAQARGVAIRIQDGLPEMTIDPARLELVLMNLVANAIKYSDPAKPDPFVEISCVVRDDPRSPLMLIVRDNGIGVPDEMRSTIFERFTRAHADLDQELGVSGTGLGLAIVAECVEAMGGVIRCESEVGLGTVFVLELPEHVAA